MNEQPFGFVKLYTPTGVLVSLPIPVDGSIIGLQEAQAVMASVGNYLSAGFLVHEPGLDEGEARDLIGWVCRRSKTNKDDSETPIIDLYVDHEKMEYKILSVYLNTPEDVSAFQSASGLKLDKLPLLVSAGAPKRGTNRQIDSFIIRVPRPFGVIHEKNPAFDESDPDSMKPKRRFVRWDAAAPEIGIVQKPAAPPAPPQSITPSSQPSASEPDPLQWVDDIRAGKGDTVETLPQNEAEALALAVNNKYAQHRKHYENTVAMLMREGSLDKDATPAQKYLAVKARAEAKQAQKETA